MEMSLKYFFKNQKICAWLSYTYPGSKILELGNKHKKTFKKSTNKKFYCSNHVVEIIDFAIGLFCVGFSFWSLLFFKTFPATGYSLYKKVSDIKFQSFC